MRQLSVNQFQVDCPHALMSVIAQHDILRVRQQTPEVDVVILRADEWEQLQATLDVLGNHGLMRQIAASLRTLAAGSGYHPTPEELHEIVSV